MFFRRINIHSSLFRCSLIWRGAKARKEGREDGVERREWRREVAVRDGESGSVLFLGVWSSGWQPGTPAKVCCCGLPVRRSRGSAGENITPLHCRGSSQPTEARCQDAWPAIPQSFGACHWWRKGASSPWRELFFGAASIFPGGVLHLKTLKSAVAAQFGLMEHDAH